MNVSAIKDIWKLSCNLNTFLNIKSGVILNNIARLSYDCSLTKKITKAHINLHCSAN